MIKINLLPENLRHQRLVIPKGLLGTCGLTLILISFFSFLIINTVLIQKNKELKTIEDKWQKILDLKKELGLHKREIENLEQRSKVIDYLMANRILWSKKLNELSDLITDGIWLNKVELDKKLLTMEGSVYSENKDEEAIVGNFMNSIKRHKSFFKDFNDIELKIIKRKEGDIEYVNFVVYCGLKEKQLKDESTDTKSK